MNPSEICRFRKFKKRFAFFFVSNENILATIILCLIVLLHYSICQPISIEDNDENDAIRKSSVDSDFNDEFLPNIYFLHSELNEVNQPNTAEPVRRANFWKRANFWRKRANFWRRDLSS